MNFQRVMGLFFRNGGSKKVQPKKVNNLSWIENLRF
jgi:hypothetical protein